MFKPKQRAATQKVHEEQLKHMATLSPGPDGLSVLVGDSFMERLEWDARLYPDQFPAHTALLAKGGDTIEHLLWRLQNTPGSVQVRKVVLLIGTNNLGCSTVKVCKYTPQDIALGIVECRDLLRGLYPNADIVILPLAPRSDVTQAQIDSVNRELAGEPGFLPSFWTDLGITEYRPGQYCDHVHLNKVSYGLFHKALLALL